MVCRHGVRAYRDPWVPRVGRKRHFQLDCSSLEGKRECLRGSDWGSWIRRQLYRGVCAHRLYFYHEVQVWALNNLARDCTHFVEDENKVHPAEA